MKKIIYIIIGVLFFLVLFQKPKKQDELRIRVIANSDEVFDQEVKYKVVSCVMLSLTDLPSIDDKEQYILDNLEEIKESIKVVLFENNVISGGFSVELTKEKFPIKSRNDKVIPGGIYKTLLVKIGHAQGKNWWSLLYPEFFSCSYEDVNSGEIIIRSYFWDKFKNIIN